MPPKAEEKALPQVAAGEGAGGDRPDRRCVRGRLRLEDPERGQALHERFPAQRLRGRYRAVRAYVAGGQSEGLGTGQRQGKQLVCPAEEFLRPISGHYGQYAGHFLRPLCGAGRSVGHRPRHGRQRKEGHFRAAAGHRRGEKHHLFLYQRPAKRQYRPH